MIDFVSPIGPKEFIEFIHAPAFDRMWSKLGLDDASDMLALQEQIMRAPKLAPVIAGAGGARKLRFSPQGSQTGKSGAMRVIYAYVELHKVVILAFIYPKSVRENIGPEDKRRIKNAIAEIERDVIQ